MRNNDPRNFTEAQKRERALISAMRDWALEPGQMLFLGPKSVAALTDGNYHPTRMKDMHIIPKSEWSNPLTAAPGRATRKSRT